MSEQENQLTHKLWTYLQAGQWDDAFFTASRMVETDAANTEILALARCIREIALFADKVKHGTTLENDDVLKLEQFARDYPRLAALDSFKALSNLAGISSANMLQKQPEPAPVIPGPAGPEIQVSAKKVKSRVTRQPAVTAAKTPVSPQPEKVNVRKWFHKILHPGARSGIVVSISVMIVFTLLINTLAFYYLQTHPPSTTDFKAWDSFTAIQTWDKGVNTLLLGDSSSGVNLDEGAFTDRLGGQTASLALYGGYGFIYDAWLLSMYVQKFGAPSNVVISHITNSYPDAHDTELLATVPLPWGFWDKLGVTPAWKEGELENLFITKYLPLYSYADVLRERLNNIPDLFHVSRSPRAPAMTYTHGRTNPQETMTVTTEFNPSLDSTNALRYMADLAREKHFQLYLLFQPEWDGAINSVKHLAALAAQEKYLSQFTDDTYVHIDRNESLTFTSAQMESTSHLRPGADHIKTESDIEGIISIQNQLTAGDAVSFTLDSFSLNKSKYVVGDKPVVNITFSAQNQTSTTDITGSVSCLVKPAGETDGEWVCRASAVSYTMGADGKVSLKLQLSQGALPKAGNYDLVLFIRQDVGNLSNETRIEKPGRIITGAK